MERKQKWWNLIECIPDSRSLSLKADNGQAIRDCGFGVRDMPLRLSDQGQLARWTGHLAARMSRHEEITAIRSHVPAAFRLIESHRRTWHQTEH